MSDAMLSPAEIRDPSTEKGADQDPPNDVRTSGREHYPPAHLVSPAELAAQLLANPKLAALRSPKAASPISPPILTNPKCSGYFVEPVCAWSI